MFKNLSVHNCDNVYPYKKVIPDETTKILLIVWCFSQSDGGAAYPGSVPGGWQHRHHFHEHRIPLRHPGASSQAGM